MYHCVSILFKTDCTNPDDIQSIDPLILDLSTLREATDNFAESNKLGQGGFGVVYKVVEIILKSYMCWCYSSQMIIECAFWFWLHKRRAFSLMAKK
jgi:hypothetical protein